MGIYPLVIKFPTMSTSISVTWHGVLDHTTNEGFLSNKILQTLSQIHTQDTDIHLSFCLDYLNMLLLGELEIKQSQPNHR